MVGLFDSGSGGINTVRCVKEQAPDVDLVYLIDRERAPYGTRSENELISITSENIERLTDMGARRVLIACCTASTVHEKLPKHVKEISLPIISAVARSAKNSTRTRRIGVIATNHTVSTHAFGKALGDCEVYEHPLAELVGMIDSGLSDATVTDADERLLHKMLEPVLSKRIDTLILGCTHFPALIRTLGRIAAPYGVISVIDSARIGAEIVIAEARKIKDK